MKAQDQAVVFEKPTLRDIPQMLTLVEPEVKMGKILPRSVEVMANTIRSYVIAKMGEGIVGFCALYIYDCDLAEVRSLVVDEKYRGQGIGARLIAKILAEGEKLGISNFLVLTHKPEFFKDLGFEMIAQEKIPNQKIQLDCKKCKNFHQCNEVALIKRS